MDLLNNIANLKVDTVLGAVDKYVPGAQNKLKNLADKAKAYVNNVSELELKVLEATNHDPWGPHGSVMQGVCATGTAAGHKGVAPVGLQGCGTAESAAPFVTNHVYPQPCM